MDLTQPIQPGTSLTWKDAIDVLNDEQLQAEKGDWDKTKVTELIQSSPLVEAAFHAAKQKRDKAKEDQTADGIDADRVGQLQNKEIRYHKLVDIAGKAICRSLEKEKVGQLTFGRRHLSAKKFAQMTSGKRWFFQRIATRLHLLIKGYGLYLRSSDIALSATFRQRVNQWGGEVPKSMQYRLTTLQATLQKLPALPYNGEMAKIANPVAVQTAINNYEDLAELLKNDPALADRRLPNGLWPIEFALAKLSFASVRALVSANADLELRTQEGLTLSDAIRLQQIHGIDNELLKPIDSLITALELKDLETFKTLAKEEQKRKATDSQGNTALHTICEKYTHEKDYAQALIDAGADLFVENGREKIPLDCLGSYDPNRDAIIDMMRQKGTYTTVHQAIALADTAALEKMLTKDNIDTPNAQGTPPLHYALQKPFEQKVRNSIMNVLLKHNPSLTATDARGRIPLALCPDDPALNPNYPRRTPLFEAFRANDKEKVKQLIEEGADIHALYDAQSLFGRYLLLDRPLQEVIKSKVSVDPEEFKKAIEQQNVEQVKTLLQKEPKLANVLVDQKKTAFEIVYESYQTRKESKEEKILLALLDAGSYFDLDTIPQDEGELKTKMERKRDAGTFHPFPLYDLIFHKKDDLIEKLASQPDLLNQRLPEGLDGLWGQTPLHFAVENDLNAKIVKILLKAGADVSAVEGTKGQTPLHMASKENAKLLLEKGPNLNQKDIKGQTVLEHWISKGDKEIVEAILKQKPIVEKPKRIQRMFEYSFVFTADREKLLPLLKECILTSYPASPEMGKPLIYRAIDDAHWQNGTFDQLKAIMALNPPRELLPLHYALRKYPDYPDNKDLIEALVQCGCPLDTKDEWGNTPLHLLPKDSPLIPLFITHKAPLGERNHLGQLPAIGDLTLALASPTLDPNEELSCGYRPLDLCLLNLARLGNRKSEGSGAYQEFLLGLTPFHTFGEDEQHAIYSQLVRQFLERGGNPNRSCSALGRSTISLARQHRRELGGDIYSALLHAARYNQP